jgi:hypothetical protein
LTGRQLTQQGAKKTFKSSLRRTPPHPHSPEPSDLCIMKGRSAPQSLPGGAALALAGKTAPARSVPPRLSSKVNVQPLLSATTIQIFNQSSAARKPLCASSPRQGLWPDRRRPGPAPRPATESPLASLEGEDAGLGASAVSGAALALWPRWAPSLLASEQVRAFWRMARPINFLPSFLLVLLGAWVRMKCKNHPAPLCPSQRAPSACPA